VAPWRRRLTTSLGRLILFAQERFARELDPVLIINGNHFDLKMVADLADTLHLIHVLVIQLADVAKPVAPR